MKRLRLILGDQLNARHSWFEEKDPETIYLIAELHQEATYVRHHLQKVVAFFTAMDRFAQALKSAGHQVSYLTLDETQPFGALADLIDDQMRQHGCSRFEYQRPDEWRLLGELRGLKLNGDPEVQEWDSEHFLVHFDAIERLFKPSTAQRMEAFYRKMRKRTGYLMTGDQPLGGQWNYDADNRNKFKPADLKTIPAPLLFSTPVGEIKERIKRHRIDTLGSCPDQLIWPTSRQEALELLEFFCTHCLERFGTFQDAMTDRSDAQWSLYHSRLSFALNAKILSPAQVIERSLREYEERSDEITLSQIEGFVRQILGWREFIRGLYWVNMPDYAQKNELNATRDLPDFYWTGETKMNCMERAISQSLSFSYAHHIQRLMVTGNFALLSGVDPAQVDQWYLGIYIDAIEWVELPNTRGMSQFADGGWVASKPYVSSGQYIQRMSDYCSQCHYQVKLKHEPEACPFNSLYWDFMVRHRERLERNPRIGMVYRNWDKQEEAQRQRVLDRARWCLEHLDQL